MGLELLWHIYIYAVTPVVLILMGSYALRRVWKEWRTMKWHMRIVFTIDGICFPPLGLFLLGYSLYLLFT